MGKREVVPDVFNELSLELASQSGSEKLNYRLSFGYIMTDLLSVMNFRKTSRYPV